MSFERAFAAVIVVEGGWSNNPADPGGETYMGISRVHWPRWAGWPLIDECRRKGRALSLEPGLAGLVRLFYLTEFWSPLRCPEVDLLAPDVAEELFEASVNCGQGNGVKFLQRALNALSGEKTRLYPDLLDDGGFGPKTMAALTICLRKRDADLVVNCQNGEQYLHYKKWIGHKDFPGVFRRTSPGMFGYLAAPETKK